jgi:hypothetical protein
VIQKKDIEGKVVVHEKSIMPEGLANNMTVQDFRDLIRYSMAHPFITEVQAAGPYSGREEFFPFDMKDPLGSGKNIAWTKLSAGPPGRIALPAIKQLVWIYLVAEVTAPEAMRTRLNLGSADTVEVWVNGKETGYRGKPGAKDAAPDQASVDVQLAKGVNRLVFRVSYSGANAVLNARLLDPDRKLRYGEPSTK